MSKFTGNYTTDVKQGIKGSARLMCRVTDDGAVYFCNAYFLYRMHPAEYAATVQPVVKCDAGNWDIINGTKTAGDGNSIVKLFNDAAKNCAGAVKMERCPMIFPAGKGAEQVAYYGDGLTVFFNAAFLAGINPGLVMRCTGEKSAAVIYDGDGEPVAMVMPVYDQDENRRRAIRAVEAYFNGAADSKPADDEKLRDAAEKHRKDASVIDELTGMVGRLTREIDSLKAELEKAQAAGDDAAKAAPDDAAKTDGSAADRAGEVAGRLCELDGLQVVVNGATTATPVVWISGDVNAHADAIRAEGGKYSVKKGAYYIKIV